MISCTFWRSRKNLLNSPKLSCGFNPFRIKTPNIYYQEEINLYCIINWQHKFLHFHYKSVKLDVLCRQNKIWTFGNPFQSKKLPICTWNSDLHNLCICCQFEDSQIISPKIIPMSMSHRNILTVKLWQMRAHCLQYILIIFLFLLEHISEFSENLIKSYCTRPHFDVVYV